MKSYDVGTTRVASDIESVYITHAVPQDAPRPEGMLPIRVPALCGTKINRFAFRTSSGDFDAMILEAQRLKWMRICTDCEQLATREDDHA